MTIQERAKAIAAQLPGFSERPAVGFLLGSGWSNALRLTQAQQVPFKNLQGMPVCGVAGHAGNFIFGKIVGKSVAASQGRFHLYEGRDVAEAVLPVAVMYELGVRTLVLTNAAGGLNTAYAAGDLMVLRDHINLTGKNPLVGVTPSAERPVFIDMSGVYDAALRQKIMHCCAQLSIACREGVYLQVLGPSYETPAEVLAYQKLGADAVGMSTAVEAIYARYLGMRIAGISCITNLGAGLFSGIITHTDVLERTRLQGEMLAQLFEALVQEL